MRVLTCERAAGSTQVLPKVTDHSSPLGKSWQDTFSAQTAAQAEAAMRAAGVAWEWRAGEDLKTISQPMAALVTDARTGLRVEWAETPR